MLPGLAVLFKLAPNSWAQWILLLQLSKWDFKGVPLRLAKEFPLNSVLAHILLVPREQ